VGAAGPRLFGIVATEAPVVAVLRRGPSAWCHVARWWVDGDIRYEPGAWLHGTIYPQRCDLSPDGRYLCWFTLHPGASWPLGATYVAVSRLPWLTALVAWGTGGTWTRGLHFVPTGTGTVVDAPDHGSLTGSPYGLAHTLSATFAVERRRGWTETPDTPPRSPNDYWDERRSEQVTMQKESPAGGSVLLAHGGFAAFRSMDQRWYGGPEYAVRSPDGVRVRLDGVQWADWAPDGRLLVATVDGRLEVRSAPGDEVLWSRDVGADIPDPVRAPDDVRTW
jgi:hypothetical protein